MDEQALAFHRRVREGYLAMAAQEPERWLVSMRPKRSRRCTDYPEIAVRSDHDGATESR